MRIAIISLVLALVHHLGLSQTIRWDKNVKLRWCDFEGKVDKRSPFAAASAVGVVYKFNSFNKGRVYKIKFTINAVFDPAKSWSKRTEQTAAILKHEQLHFDIAELVSRAFAKEAMQTVYSKNYRSEVSRMFMRYTNTLKKLQLKYDQQTLHSNNKSQQKYWERLVHQELKE